ncbi:Inosine-5'-monophosphate dehydrogenase [ANME-1 cluster archaeon GoMg1]|nr:Inosine-5'-monophosphate dehydrogenase [ANME-1 cluster archaeon GoMg1]
MQTKTNVKVKELMTTDVIAFKPHEKIPHVVKVFRTNRISGAPVIDDQRQVIGIISEADIMKLTATVPFPDIDPLNPFPVFSLSSYMKKVKKIPDEIETLFEGYVKDVMTKKPVTISPDDSISDAARLMHKNDFKRIPVVDVEGKLVGVIARGDVIGVFAKYSHSKK